MDKKQEFYFNQFKKMFSELDKDKKQKLHDYLEKLSPDERAEYAVKMGKRYYDKNKSPKSQPASQSAVSKSHKPTEASGEKKTSDEKKTSGEKKAKPLANPVSKSDGSKSVSKPASKQPPKRRRGLLKPILVAVSIALLAVCAIKVKDIMNKKDNTLPEPSETASASTSDTVESNETSETVLPTATPEPTATPTPLPSPSATPIPLDENAPDLSGKTIVIDPGHQEIADENEENCASWLSLTKPRCTSGCVGVVTQIHEYEYTLEFSMLLKNYLEACGAEVYLTRETNEINISNQERAQFALDKNADLFLRIHADGANDSLESGVRVYVPDSGNYTNTNVAQGNNLGNAVAEALGLSFDNAFATYVYTGLNYADTIPSFQLNLGFLTNSDDESALLDESKQLSAVKAISEFCQDF